MHVSSFPSRDGGRAELNHFGKGVNHFRKKQKNCQPFQITDGAANAIKFTWMAES
ncbi:MAG: hypothetical protein J5698_06520 [Bacteroidaceae bacterium]|nr:hypothetical protein [Bacteroidaceae bacterium]